MGVKLGILMLILFGSHALLEYFTGGYKDQKCKFHKSHYKYIWSNDDN